MFSYDASVRDPVLKPMLSTAEECAAVVERLGASVRRAVGGAGAVLERASALMEEEKTLADNARLLERFNARFMVTAEERALLAGQWSTSAAGSSSSSGGTAAAAAAAAAAAGGSGAASAAEPRAPPREFYAALARLERVRRDCAAVLISARHQQAGLDIMDEVSSIQDAAFESLFRWVQRSTASMLEADEPETAETLSAAISALGPRPALQRCALDEAAGARRTAVTRRFRLALTRGEGGSRPIELSAHDPLRYAGDMLAWVHQTAAVEGDLFKGLVRGELRGRFFFFFFFFFLFFFLWFNSIC
jgi:hypothetical protein